MAAAAPGLAWRGDLPAGGWQGLAPVWAASRPMPEGLQSFLAGRRMRLRITYSEGFPMVPPRLYPLDPEPEVIARTDHRWHVEGDGALCLMQSTSDWHPSETAADLVRKASGWFVEYLLMTEGHIDQMTERGLVEDASLDDLITEVA